MKRRSFTILALVMTLLTSCNKKEIRSDIAEFIAPFSLETAVEAYKKAEMEKSQIVHLDGDETITLETITFDVTDTVNPQYHQHMEKYVNDELKETSDTVILIKEDKYYIVINDVEYESTLEKCHDLVKTFFYKETYLDGTYHNGGYYYGDIVKGSIEDYQNFIEIKDNKLEFSFCRNESANGEEVKRCSNFIVDEVGMMIYNRAETTAETKSAETIINIKKN